MRAFPNTSGAALPEPWVRSPSMVWPSRMRKVRMSVLSQWGFWTAGSMSIRYGLGVLTRSTTAEQVWPRARNVARNDRRSPKPPNSEGSRNSTVNG